MKNARKEAQPYLRADLQGNIVFANAAGAGVADILRPDMLLQAFAVNAENKITDFNLPGGEHPVPVIMIPIAEGVVILPLPANHDVGAWLLYSATEIMDGWDKSLVDAMAAAIEQLGPEQQGLLQSFDALQLIPNNMRIVASRLEPSGGPVSVISENYKVSSMVLAQRLHGFVGPDSVCSHAVDMMFRLRMLMGASSQLHLIHTQMKAAGETEAEEAWFDRTFERLHRDVPEKILKVRNATAALNASSAEVRRLMLGLDTIRVLGRVESSRMRDAGGLSSTIDQLDAFHGEIKVRLERIMSLSESVRFSARYASATMRPMLRSVS